jgi:hypothetical protein
MTAGGDVIWCQPMSSPWDLHAFELAEDEPNPPLRSFLMGVDVDYQSFGSAHTLAAQRDTQTVIQAYLKLNRSSRHQPFYCASLCPLTAKLWAKLMGRAYERWNEV